MQTTLLQISPVLPSQDIRRDVEWYKDHVGFEPVHGDDMYAVLRREKVFIHLQWHAGTEDDPLLGGSVVRIFVKNIEPIFNELVEKGTVNKDKLRPETPWQTKEFGFFDLNDNAIFFVEDL